MTRGVTSQSYIGQGASTTALTAKQHGRATSWAQPEPYPAGVSGVSSYVSMMGDLNKETRQRLAESLSRWVNKSSVRDLKEEDG